MSMISIYIEKIQALHRLNVDTQVLYSSNIHIT